MTKLFLSILIVVIHFHYGMMSSSSVVMDPSIIIVGGGVSGVSAATRLIDKGFKNIKILEAESRYGGRIFTVPFGENVVDIGAQWCHGEKKNVVFQLANPYNLLGIDADTENWIMTKPNGQKIPISSANRLMTVLESLEDDYWRELEVFKGSLGDFMVKKYYEIVNTPKYATISKEIKAQVLEFHSRYTNIDSSADSWFNVSAPGEIEYWECEGNSNLNWKGNGYSTIFKLLTKSYPTPTSNSINIEDKLLLNRQVSEIVYNLPNNDFVTVKTKNGETYDARHVIVTVSLGVLKANYGTLFNPKLPDTKVNAIKGLGFGVMDKLFLEFEEPFWNDNFDGLNIIWTDNELVEIRKREDSYIEGIVAFELVTSQPNLLLGWITGAAARRMEVADENKVKEGCMFLLRKFLPSMTIPDPVTFRRTAWYTNPNTRGVYSFRSVQSDQMKATAKQLAQPILNSKKSPVVLFAGEATHDHYYSTVHGAIETGWREADRIAKLYNK